MNYFFFHLGRTENSTVARQGDQVESVRYRDSLWTCVILFKLLPFPRDYSSSCTTL